MLQKIILIIPILAAICMLWLVTRHRTTNKLVNILGGCVLGLISILMFSYKYYVIYDNDLSQWMFFAAHLSCILLFPVVDLYITAFTTTKISWSKWLLLGIGSFMIPCALLSYELWHKLHWLVLFFTLWVVAAYCAIDTCKLLYVFIRKVRNHFDNISLLEEGSVYSHLHLFGMTSAIALMFYTLLHIHSHEMRYVSTILYLLSALMVIHIGHNMLIHHKHFNLYHDAFAHISDYNKLWSISDFRNKLNEQNIHYLENGFNLYYALELIQNKLDTQKLCDNDKTKGWRKKTHVYMHYKDRPKTVEIPAVYEVEILKEMYSKTSKRMQLNAAACKK